MDLPLRDYTPLLITIERLLAKNDLDALRLVLADYHPADIADTLEQLPPETAVRAFRLLPDFEASEVLDEANSSLTAVLIEQVDDERLADLLDTLPMDDAAELLEDMPDAVSEQLIELMEPDEQREVRTILSYPEDSAGRLMTKDLAVLREQWTAAQAIDYLRALEETEETETIHYLYVTDVIGRLLGVVPIRNLVLAPADSIIKTIMIDDIIAISAESDQEELAEQMSKYDYVALPVVDGDGRLLGVVTVDDALDILEEELTEDIQQLGGSAPLENPYFSVTTGTMVRKRVGWLVLLFAASFLTSFVIRSFDNLLVSFTILTQFIPLVTSTGGNAGSQTVATVIRAIAVGEVQLQDLGRTMRREVTVGLLMGILLAMLGFLYAQLLGMGFRIGLVIALTLPAVLVWSNAVASFIPIIAERWKKIDATVVSAPMITTIVDATGLLIYLVLASLIL